MAKNRINLSVCKSSRHSKITGDFAEHLILYWLSKYGFECAQVDHTGIDLIARNSITNEIMGISVKSRSRNEGKEGRYLNIPKDNFEKIDLACKAFGCVPYMAIVVDEENSIKVFILSKERLLEYFPIGQNSVGWKMTESWIKKYNADKQIIKFTFDYRVKNWW